MLKLLAWIFFILVALQVLCNILIWALQKLETDDDIDIIEATKK